MSESDALVVFTAKSPEHILRDGGSGSWVLNESRARMATWVICTQNRHNSEEYADPTEPHGSAFLIARISDLVPVRGDKGEPRWKITFTEYARIAIPEVWRGWRNPVKYATLEDLEIDLGQLRFESSSHNGAASARPKGVATRLTIDEAKKGLAATFGVRPEAVEITIRG